MSEAVTFLVCLSALSSLSVALNGVTTSSSPSTRGGTVGAKGEERLSLVTWCREGIAHIAGGSREVGKGNACLVMLATVRYEWRYSSARASRCFCHGMCC